MPQAVAFAFNVAGVRLTRAFSPASSVSACPRTAAILNGVKNPSFRLPACTLPPPVAHAAKVLLAANVMDIRSLAALAKSPGAFHALTKGGPCRRSNALITPMLLKTHDRTGEIREIRTNCEVLKPKL